MTSLLRQVSTFSLYTKCGVLGYFAILLFYCGFCYPSFYADGVCFVVAFLVLIFLVIVVLSYLLGICTYILV
jgi:hypothetical protein